MKLKTAFLLITCCLFCGQPVSAESITLGYVDFPPYEFKENGKPGGMLVIIVETVFSRAGIPLELQFLPFKRAYFQAKNGDIDGLFNFYKTRGRLNFFDYSRPVIENPLMFFVRKDSTIQFNNIEDLKGLRIGVINGYTYGTDFDQSPLFIREGANEHIFNIKKLLLGRIDAYPCDRLVGIHVAAELALSSEIKILPKPLTVMDGHIGFTKGKHADVIDKINVVITEMHKNGEIARIIRQYIEDRLAKPSHENDPNWKTLLLSPVEEPYSRNGKK